jgi:GWxTD domain-containing protein
MNMTENGKHTLKALLLAIPVLAFISCKTIQTTVDTKDLSYIYNPTRNQINPLYNVTNQLDDKTLLSVKFFASELFFSEANPTGVPTAEMSISVKLFNVTQGKVLADTAVYNINIQKQEGRSFYIYGIPLKVSKGMEYNAEVKILDRLRAIVVQAFVPFNTLSSANKYNFVAQDGYQKSMLFTHVIRAGEYVNLIYLKSKIDSMFISFYKPFRGIPDPPSMLLPQKTLDYGPDTIVRVPYSDTVSLMFPREGVFKCTIGRDTVDGFTFMNFGTTFPEMKTPEAMIEPLAYLANPDELNDLRSAPKPKLALDEFWINCGKNVDKARELIRIYYTRVQYANHYFTSFEEGWRTERGMVYIVYGPPDKVYKTSDGENWGYKKPVLKSSWGPRYKVKEEYLYFNFKKKDNIFTDNDYFLSRSQTLVTLWEQAIASWRKGIVFRFDNPVQL